MFEFNAKQYPAYQLGFDAFNAMTAGECAPNDAFDRINEDQSVTAQMAFVDGWGAAREIYEASLGTGAFVAAAAQHLEGV